MMKGAVMKSNLNALIVEDNSSDAELLVVELRKYFEVTHRCVQTEDAFLDAVNPTIDIILADYSLPQFGALRVLVLLKHYKLDIPVVVVSGTVGEEVAVKTIKEGACDYLLKDRLARLGVAVTHAIDEKRLLREKKRASIELREKLEELEKLTEIMMGREERILELKAEIEILKAQVLEVAR